MFVFGGCILLVINLLFPWLACTHRLHAGADTGADPASNFRGGAISAIFGCQVSWQLHYCKRENVCFTKLL